MFHTPYEDRAVDESRVKIRPLFDRLIIKVLEKKEKSDGGIHIPENAKERPQIAEVLAVGDGKVLENDTVVKMTVKVGDHIYFSKNAVLETTINKKELLVLREEDVLAVVDL